MTSAPLLLEGLHSDREWFLDHLIERSNRVLGLDAALPQDVTSIQNWVKSGDLARGETAYLEDEKDLFYVKGARNNELR